MSGDPWFVERTVHNMGAGVSGAEPLPLPPNCVIVLARIQDSEFFNVIVDGEQIPDVFHRSDSIVARVAEFLAKGESNDG